MTPQTVPDVVFNVRVRNDALDGPNPYEWKQLSTADVFAGKKVVLFAVPGAFTPACSETHLPGYERLHDDFAALMRELGVSNPPSLMHAKGSSRPHGAVYRSMYTDKTRDIVADWYAAEISEFGYGFDDAAE